MTKDENQPTIEVYEVEDGESRAQYPFTGIPADVVPAARRTHTLTAALEGQAMSAAPGATGGRADLGA